MNNLDLAKAVVITVCETTPDEPLTCTQKNAVIGAVLGLLTSLEVYGSEQTLFAIRAAVKNFERCGVFSSV